MEDGESEALARLADLLLCPGCGETSVRRLCPRCDRLLCSSCHLSSACPPGFPRQPSLALAPTVEAFLALRRHLERLSSTRPSGDCPPTRESGDSSIASWGLEVSPLLGVIDLSLCSCSIEAWPSGSYSREARPEKASLGPSGVSTSRRGPTLSASSESRSLLVRGDCSAAAPQSFSRPPSPPAPLTWRAAVWPQALSPASRLFALILAGWTRNFADTWRFESSSEVLVLVEEAVARKSGRRLCQRSFNYLNCLAAGAWVLDSRWLEESVSRGKLVFPRSTNGFSTEDLEAMLEEYEVD